MYVLQSCEEIAAPNVISNLLIYFDNEGADFLKQRSDRLHPQTIKDHNLDTFLHKNLKSHKGKGEHVSFPSRDAVWLSQSFPA